MLLAQEYSPRWTAETRTASEKPARSFGWANVFKLGGTGPRIVRVTWHGQAFHRLMLFMELLLVVGIASAWSRRAARERGER
jgi:hypothetical protein